jgi:hypothetical protein
MMAVPLRFETPLACRELDCILMWGPDGKQFEIDHEGPTGLETQRFPST